MRNRNINNFPQTKELDLIIQNINQDIFDEKIWIWEKMWKIAEVTYSYSSKDKKTNEDIYINWELVNINYTLFCEIWWLDLKNFNSFSDEEKVEKIKTANNNLVKKIEEKKSKIKKAIKQLESINAENYEEKIKSEIYIKSLQEKINLLDYCLNWLVYELQKAWLEIILTKEEQKEIDRKQEELDKKLFWWKVSQNQEEINNIYRDIYKDFEKNKNKLTKEEQERYKYFIEKVKALLWKNFEYKEIQEPQSLIEKYEKFMVWDDIYIDSFNSFIKIIWDLEHRVVQNQEVWSISDWPLLIEFPTKKEFKNLSLARILKLNAHEIEVHSITDFNNKNILWNLRWANSTEKDEWLAILMENILEYWNWLLTKDEKTGKDIFDLDKFKLPKSIQTVLMWEILDNKDFLEFLQLKEKLWLSKVSAKTSFLRAKRSNNMWVQHKDTTYYRWLVKIVKEINIFILSDWKNGINFYDLFIWKCDIEDTKKLTEIKNINYKKPVFVSDAILFILEWGKTEEDFVNYLSNKYTFIDFSDKKIKAIMKSTKNKTSEIVWQLIQKK